MSTHKDAYTEQGMQGIWTKNCKCSATYTTSCNHTDHVHTNIDYILSRYNYILPI